MTDAGSLSNSVFAWNGIFSFLFQISMECDGECPCKGKIYLQDEIKLTDEQIEQLKVVEF